MPVLGSPANSGRSRCKFPLPEPARKDPSASCPRPDFTSLPFHLRFHLPKRPAAETSPRARMTLAPGGRGRTQAAPGPPPPAGAVSLRVGRRAARHPSPVMAPLLADTVESKRGSHYPQWTSWKGPGNFEALATQGRAAVTPRTGGDHRQGCSRQAVQLAPRSSGNWCRGCPGV